MKSLQVNLKGFPITIASGSRLTGYQQVGHHMLHGAAEHDYVGG